MQINSANDSDVYKFACQLARYCDIGEWLGRMMHKPGSFVCS
jgi:hypothetical protein